MRPKRKRKLSPLNYWYCRVWRMRNPTYKPKKKEALFEKRPMNLEELTDAELNSIFHVEVAGGTINGPKSAGILLPQSALQPKYCTDANAVLPWLSRTHCECRNNPGGGWRVSIFETVPSLRVVGASYEPFFPLARAAVIALLMAKRAEKGL